MSKIWNNLKKQYESWESEPTGDLWEKLEAQLNASDTPSYERGTPKKSITNLLYAVAASVVFFIALILYTSKGVDAKIGTESIISKNKIERTLPIPPDNFGGLREGTSLQKALIVNEDIKIRCKESLNETTSVGYQTSGKRGAIVSTDDPAKFFFATKKVDSVHISQQVFPAVEHSTVSVTSDKDAIVNYVTSEDLLFSRDLQKYHNSHPAAKFSTALPEKISPKSLQILGVEMLPSQN